MEEFVKSEEVFSSAIESMYRDGSARLPEYLSSRDCIEVQRILEREEFSHVVESHEHVDENYYRLDNPSTQARRAINKLTTRIRGDVLDCRNILHRLKYWQPTAVAQLYKSDSFITSHQDRSYNFGMVAVLTVQGRGLFCTSTQRNRPIINEWVLNPGDLVLLRSVGLGFDGDPRLFHSVGGAIGEEDRLSINFRHILNKT